MKDFIIGISGALICGLLTKGNFVTYIFALLIACGGLWYIIKKKPQKTMFYGILAGIIIILLLPANFRWL